MSTTSRIAAMVTMAVPVLYIGSCSAITHMREHGFAHIKKGNTESQAIAAMGLPFDREIAGIRRLPQHGAPECVSPCSQRLWYPNRLTLTGEAWAIDLDKSGRVVDTAHITSP